MKMPRKKEDIYEYKLDYNLMEEVSKVSYNLECN